MSEVGSLLRIPGKITMLHGNVITVERQSGSFKGRLLPNGNLQVRVLFYGFMANVSVSREHLMRLMRISFSQLARGRPSFGSSNVSFIVVTRTNDIGAVPQLSMKLMR
jgi:hypothetical protein